MINEFLSKKWHSLLPLTVALIALLSVSCNGDHGLVEITTGRGKVGLRVLNNSDYDFEQLTVNGIDFGDLPRYAFSRYRIVEQLYHYGAVRFEIDGKEFRIIPIDFVGETPLKNGLYTYMLSVDFDSGRIYLTFFEGERVPGEEQPQDGSRVLSVKGNSLATDAAVADGGGTVWIAGLAITLTRLNPTVSSLPNSRMRYLPDLVAVTEKRQPLVIQIDAVGNEVARFEPALNFGTNSEILVASSDDDGVVLAGHSRVIQSGDDDGVLLAKLSSSGEIVWLQQLTTSNEVRVHGLHRLDDGGFILSGAEQQRTWLLRTDNAGNQLWSRRLSGQFVGEDVRTGNDGGFIVTGGRFGDVSSTPTSGLTATDANGMEIWTTSPLEGSFWAGIQTSGGNFLLAGRRFYNDLLLVYLDDAGIPIWERLIDDGHAFDVEPTPAGDFVLSGIIQGNNALVQVDSLGNVIWQRTFGATSYESIRGYVVLPTRDGQYLLVGNTEREILLAKVDGQGQTIFVKSIL